MPLTRSSNVGYVRSHWYSADCPQCQRDPGCHDRFSCDESKATLDVQVVPLEPER